MVASDRVFPHPLSNAGHLGLGESEPVEGRLQPCSRATHGVCHLADVPEKLVENGSDGIRLARVELREEARLFDLEACCPGLIALFGIPGFGESDARSAL